LSEAKSRTALEITNKEFALRKFRIIGSTFFGKSALPAKLLFHAVPNFWATNEVRRRFFRIHSR
jgi:hypothetical protein